MEKQLEILKTYTKCDTLGQKTTIIASFSGGRTSAYMTKILKETHGDNLKVVFMNTGLEHEKTLEFVNRCDIEFNLGVVWIEAVVNPAKGKSTTYKVVDFKSACRNTAIAEDVVSKYGLFGVGYLHCTREMKLQPFNAWVRDNIAGEYKTAIGIRADEVDRMDARFEKKNLTYPLIKLGITKKDVVGFWSKQIFDLDLPDYLGNCVACWKKSSKKLKAIASEMPDEFNKLKALERKANGKGADKMFREHKSADDFAGCGEYCEVF